MASEIVPSPMVLIVDDEALIRWSLSEGLSDGGYEVRLAGSAAEARHALAASANAPFIVVLDLRLPDVTDLSFLREVRRTRPDCPVLMMSAHGTPEDAEEATRLGVTRFVGKPFDVAEMVKLVGEFWSARA